MNPEIRCSYTRMVPMSELQGLRNPRNRNLHPPEQIDELVEQFKYQGVRHPIIISKRCNMFAAGDGRFQAAERLGMTEYPVDFQDFDNEEQEYAFAIADNALQRWATLDMAAINFDLPELGPDFDIDRLGIRDFVLDMSDKEKVDVEEHERGLPGEEGANRTECPRCGYLV
jgi:hypothetical protein